MQLTAKAVDHAEGCAVLYGCVGSDYIEDRSRFGPIEMTFRLCSCFMLSLFSK